MMADKRVNIRSNTLWEEQVCYSRAVRIGNIIEVAGTTAVDGDDIIGQGDPYKQTQFILGKIKIAILDAGGLMTDVVRTRMYVKDINDWEAIGQAHAEFFKGINPAATMVEISRLIHPDLLVEIEVTAIVSDTYK